MKFDRDKLNKAMEAGFFTNVKLGVAAGVAPNTVNRARQGLKVQPSSAERICKALGVKVEQIRATEDTNE